MQLVMVRFGVHGKAFNLINLDRWCIGAIAFTLLVFFAGTAANATTSSVQTGDIIVTISNFFDNSPSAIVDVNPRTGVQTLMTSGQNLDEPTGICVGPNGFLYISDYGGNIGSYPNGDILSVNPFTGQQKVIASGGGMVFPSAIAMDSNGTLIATAVGQTQVSGEVFKINPQTGTEQLFASGEPLNGSNGLAIDANGNYFVSNWQNNPYGGTDVVEVNPVTAAKTVIWTHALYGAEGIANDTLNPGKLLLAFDPYPSTTPSVLDINSTTGSASVVYQNGVLSSPVGVVEDPSGDIYTLDPSGTGAIYDFNAVTGTESLVASGGYLNHGSAITLFSAPVPEPGSLIILPSLAILLLSRRRRHEASAV